MEHVDKTMSLCTACKMSICWAGEMHCAGCKWGIPRHVSSEFLMRLQEELARRDTTVMTHLLDGSRGVVHVGKAERAPGCSQKCRRADMCNTLELYALKHGWASWALDAAASELRGENGTRTSRYRPRVDGHAAEDDGGPLATWCSCGNDTSASVSAPGRAMSLASEVTVRIGTARHNATPEQEHLLEFAYQRGAWTGATRQILADAMWLAGPGRREIVQASGKASQEINKGSRGSVETVWLHYLFNNNHINLLADGLEMLLLGTYLTALDHGRVRAGDFTAYASEVARHASLGRWVIASDELMRRWPGIMDWHAGCVSTLGLMRALRLRAWSFAAHWNVTMHHELGGGTDGEEPGSLWTYIMAALGHDAGDLCSDARRGCLDNCYYAVGAHAGYEGVAACMDIVCDALEAVVLRDARGAIDIGVVAGSACATFERTGGNLCACPMRPSCEAIMVMASVCGHRRIVPDDAADLRSMRDAARSRFSHLPPSSRGVARLNHAAREQTYAEALRTLATGNGTHQAHNDLQVAYASAARAMCGGLRRRAASLRHRVASSSGHVLDLSSDCMCGGECKTWC